MQNELTFYQKEFATIVSIKKAAQTVSEQLQNVRHLFFSVPASISSVGTQIV
jgi:hypothetical protein